MRKRALGADKGNAGAGMSGNKQEQLEKETKISLVLIYPQPLHWLSQYKLEVTECMKT
jgi:hypothetical protein